MTGECAPASFGRKSLVWLGVVLSAVLITGPFAGHANAEIHTVGCGAKKNEDLFKAVNASSNGDVIHLGNCTYSFELPGSKYKTVPGEAFPELRSTDSVFTIT